MKPNDPVARVSVVQLGSDCGDLPGQSEPPREITDLAQWSLAVPTLHPMLQHLHPRSKGHGTCLSTGSRISNSRPGSTCPLPRCLGHAGLIRSIGRGRTLMQERMITPAQLRAGRALLGLSQAELAGRACLAIHTVKRAEADGDRGASGAAMAAIRVALEDQGVIFLEAGDEGPGVRLRRSGPPDEGLRPDQLTSENDS
jgi:hypothetical protein